MSGQRRLKEGLEPADTQRFQPGPVAESASGGAAPDITARIDSLGARINRARAEAEERVRGAAVPAAPARRPALALGGLAGLAVAGLATGVAIATPTGHSDHGSGTTSTRAPYQQPATGAAAGSASSAGAGPNATTSGPDRPDGARSPLGPGVAGVVADPVPAGPGRPYTLRTAAVPGTAASIAASIDRWSTFGGGVPPQTLTLISFAPAVGAPSGRGGAGPGVSPVTGPPAGSTHPLAGPGGTTPGGSPTAPGSGSGPGRGTNTGTAGGSGTSAAPTSGGNRPPETTTDRPRPVHPAKTTHPAHPAHPTKPAHRGHPARSHHGRP